MPGDVRRRWDPGRAASREVANPSNKGNGMTLDNDGRLVVCEHVTSSVVRMDPDGTGSGREVLATHYEGKELNSPNDVVVKSDGAIYFTDPTYGRMPGLRHRARAGPRLPGRLPHRARRRRPAAARRRLRPAQRAVLLARRVAALHQRHRRARTSASSTSRTTARSRTARVLADGIGSGDLEIGDLVDGMKLDERGNVWVTGPGGVCVFSPDGEHLGTVEVPENVGNLNWGGAGLELAVHPGVDLGVPHPVQGLRQPPPLHEVSRSERRRLQLDPKRSALIIQDMQNDVIIEGGAFADSGAPAHATEQNVVANVAEPRGGVPRGGRPGDPRLVHRRAGRAGPEAERAALPGRQGGQRARPRHAGARRRPTASSRRTATTSSRRCA